MKVVLNPKHFGLRTKADDGTIWLVHDKYRTPTTPIKDMTNDILLCLCADVSADGETHTIERSVRFSDGFVCKITVEVVRDET